jgi:hypothetical protein
LSSVPSGDTERSGRNTASSPSVNRLGGHIPPPGINADVFWQVFDQNRGTFFGFTDLLDVMRSASPQLERGHRADAE